MAEARKNSRTQKLRAQILRLRAELITAQLGEQLAKHFGLKQAAVEAALLKYVRQQLVEIEALGREIRR